MRRTALAGSAALLLAVLTGCGDDAPASTANSSSPSASTEPTRGDSKDGATITACGPEAIDTEVEFRNTGKEAANFSAVVRFTSADGGAAGTAAAAASGLGPGQSASTRVTPVGTGPASGSFTCTIASVQRKAAK